MDIHNIIAEILRNPQSSVLATTVSVQGHAYRKAGAMMLLLEGGLTVGCISPGCLEVDLQERVDDTLSFLGIGHLASSSNSIEEDQIYGTGQQECEARIDQQQRSQIRLDSAGGEHLPKSCGYYRAHDCTQQPCRKVCSRNIHHWVACCQRQQSNRHSEMDS